MENDLPWRVLVPGYVGLALISAGVIAAVSDHWIVGAIVFFSGLTLFISFLERVRRHAKKHGPFVMDFERFGKTFRWW